MPSRGGIDMEDRRQFPRKDVNLKVLCRSEVWPGAKIAARSIDISKGGIGLKFKEPLYLGGKVFITIYRPFWQGHIEGEGQVAWQTVLRSGQSRVGIEFTNIGWTQVEKFLNQV